MLRGQLLIPLHLSENRAPILALSTQLLTRLRDDPAWRPPNSRQGEASAERRPHASPTPKCAKLQAHRAR
eukprot:8469179-Pyramimonas_sp.AAC.1